MDGIDHHGLKAQAGGGEESASRMTEEMAPAGETGAWKLENVSARPAENGGVIVTCSKRRELPPSKEPRNYEDTYQSKDYAFTNADEALAYIAQELSGAQGSSRGGAMTDAPPVAPGRY